MFENQPDVDRIARAKEKTSKVLDHFRYVLNLHANNMFVVYSDTLASQIPLSHAANAFNVLQRSMLQFEIVRLCGLWEADYKDNAENILIVIELIDSPSIIDALAAETRSQWADHPPSRLLTPTDTPEEAAAIEEMLRQRNLKVGDREAAKAKEALRKVIDDARAIEASPLRKSVVNLRDKLAHSITTTRLEKKAGPQPSVKYGDETKLLEATSAIVEALHLWINRAGFSIQNAREINERNAEAFWRGCNIKVLR